MSASHPRPPAPPTTRTARRRRARLQIAVATGVATALAVVLAVSVGSSGGTDDLGAGAAGDPSAGATGAPGHGSAATAPAGEVNAMGMPVMATPGTASGRASAGGVEVTGADWDLGRVPLNVAVRPTWTLRNTGAVPVTLGEPRAEVRTGCCPGPLALGATTLGPGASTTLAFELSMHAGMDGPHDLGVHVPVTAAGATEHLTLGVVGDFR